MRKTFIIDGHLEELDVMHESWSTETFDVTGIGKRQVEDLILDCKRKRLKIRTEDGKQIDRTFRDLGISDSGIPILESLIEEPTVGRGE